MLIEAHDGAIPDGIGEEKSTIYQVRMMSFTLKIVSLVLKMINFLLKMMNFCIENDAFCIENDEFCCLHQSIPMAHTMPENIGQFSMEDS